MREIAQKIITDFSWYASQGYITPRDGNGCFKIKEGSDSQYLITASGVEKPKMNLDHILCVDKRGKPIEKSKFKPSIETLAHLTALEKRGKLASVHVHSLETVALFSLAEKREFLDLLEKNLRTQWAELFRYTKVGKTVPYLYPGSKELHDAIGKSFEEKVDIIVLDQHGVLAVGNSLTDCKEHIIRLEHVSKMVLKMLTAAGGDISILRP